MRTGWVAEFDNKTADKDDDYYIEIDGETESYAVNNENIADVYYCLYDEDKADGHNDQSKQIPPLHQIFAGKGEGQRITIPVCIVVVCKSAKGHDDSCHGREAGKKGDLSAIYADTKIQNQQQSKRVEIFFQRKKLFV